MYILDLLTPYSTVARASVKACALQGMHFSRQNGNCKHLMETNHQLTYTCMYIRQKLTGDLLCIHTLSIYFCFKNMCIKGIWLNITEF